MQFSLSKHSASKELEFLPALSMVGIELHSEQHAFHNVQAKENKTLSLDHMHR